MKSKSVFILSWCVNYEGCTPLVALHSWEEAEKVKRAAEEYDKTRPKSPEASSSESDDASAAWEDYQKAYEKWENKHPLKHEFVLVMDGYLIEEVPFYNNSRGEEK